MRARLSTLTVLPEGNSSLAPPIHSLWDAAKAIRVRIAVRMVISRLPASTQQHMGLLEINHARLAADGILVQAPLRHSWVAASRIHAPTMDVPRVT